MGVRLKYLNVRNVIQNGNIIAQRRLDIALYQYSADVIINNGKGTIYRLSVFDNKKLITDMDAFEDYDSFQLASLVIEEFVNYLNKKDAEIKKSLFEKIEIKLGDYFNMMHEKRVMKIKEKKE